MGTIGRVARRTFLMGSAAIAGGVAFGAYAINRPHDNPLDADLSEGDATFNPWVKVTADGITLITPHADKGQGIASAQAALIAEEMDLEFGQFEISFGTPSAAYWNRSLSEDAAPFAPSNTGLVAEGARSTITAAFKLLGLQITGGSSSIPDSFDKLREAGAVARETLKLAAAQETGISVDMLTTQAGEVILPDGERLSYTSLAATAATLRPARNVALRPPEEWRLIGKPMKRLDIETKSTGALTFGIDVQVPGMVHATVKMNPRKGGALLGFDASAAQGMRGVKAIVPITGGVGIVANNTWRAFQAADAVMCEWGEAPYPAEQDDHWTALADSFTEAHLDREWRNDGDVEVAISAGQVIEAEYRSPYVAHAPLEPLNAVVRVTDLAVEVWTGHQVPRFAQQLVGQVTGHTPEQVILHNQFIGGSFGHRLEFDHLIQAAEIAKQMPGTPVKMTYSREEDFAQDFPRHIGMSRARGVIVDGRVNALDLSIATPSVVVSQMSRMGFPASGPDLQIVAGSWNNPYTLENLRVRGYRAPELAPVSSWRAVGAVAGGFFFDGFLDELIRATDEDPMEARIRMMEHLPYRKVLETVAEMADWGTPLDPGQGRGVAFVESFGVPVAQVVQVSHASAGLKVDHVWVACDVGTVIDPVNLESQAQGAVVFGLGHAMNCEITYSDGQAQQANYYDHEGLLLYQCPQIDVKAVEQGSKIRGIGEPCVPPVAPALANAIYDATGIRLREMPFNKFVDFA